MKEVGFGLLKEGKPCGIWPLGHVACSESIKRYMERDKANSEGPFRYEIVPVGIGNPVGLAKRAPEEKPDPTDGETNSTPEEPIQTEAIGSQKNIA